MQLTENKTSAGTIYYTNSTGEIIKKKCSSPECAKIKPLEDFNDEPNGIGGKRSDCRECYLRWQQKYRKSSHGRVIKAYHNAKTDIREVESELGISVPNNLQLYDIAVIQGYDECIYCGKDLAPGEVTLDHVKPFRSGGTNDFSNVLPACKSCNSRKGDKPLYAFLVEHVEDYYKKRVIFTLAQRQLKDYPTLLEELEAEAVSNR